MVDHVKRSFVEALAYRGGPRNQLPERFADVAMRLLGNDPRRLMRGDRERLVGWIPASHPGERYIRPESLGASPRTSPVSLAVSLDPPSVLSQKMLAI
jgi:hypothetical protein